MGAALLDPIRPETPPPSDSARGEVPRVLMVLKRHSGRGGMQQQARLVAMRMRRRAIPVLLLTNTDRKRRRQPIWMTRLPVHFLETRNQLHFAAALYEYLLRCRRAYDVVHVHGFGIEVWVALAARRVTGKPVVVKPGTAGPGTKLGLYGRLSAVAPGGLPRPWGGVDTWISLSDQSFADLRRMGVPEDRIASVPNGVDTERFRRLTADERAARRAELGVGAAEVIICTAARLLPHKRVDLLIRAFLRAAERHPQARLWILGDGPERKCLKELVRASPRGEQVRFWGHLRAHRITRVLQAGDVFALLSLYEGLSNALLEAMACGLAPVVSDVSGMTDVIRDGENGLLVSPDDEKAAMAALLRLIEDAERRAALSRAAEESVHQEFGIDRTVDRLLAVYRRVTRTAGARKRS